MKIWILNHYATNMYFDGGGRHHWFAKYLIRNGHKVKIFCSSIGHNDERKIEIDDALYVQAYGGDDVPYIFVKTKDYFGNGLDRIKNMVLFWKNVKKVCQKFIENEYKPDIILASSVHPLTLIAGMQIGKQYNIPCICEIRDLWPETLVEFGKIKRKSIITKILYRGERWIYKNSEGLIFTMPRGYEYIRSKGWAEVVCREKVFYINNGVDLDYYNACKTNNKIDDADLEERCFKVVYAGSMGEPNKIDMIIGAAEVIKNRKLNDIKFLLYGDGILKEKMERICKEKCLENVYFKGRVDKKEIPYILSKSDVAIITMADSPLYRYGISTNKVFDYLAAGKPIVCNNQCINDIFGEVKCSCINKDIADSILEIYEKDKDRYNEMCDGAKYIAEKYSFEALTNELISILKKYMR